MPTSRALSRGILLLALLGRPAAAGEVLEGTYIRAYYNDYGLWNDLAASAGLQFYSTIEGQWLDITWPDNAWTRFLVEYDQGGTSYEWFGGFDAADWTVLDAAASESGGTLEAYFEWQAGDLLITRTERWTEGRLTISVETALTNTGAVPITDLRAALSVDPDPDSDATPYGQTLTRNDVLDLDGDGIDDWAHSQGYVTAVTMGLGVCDPAAQEVGHSTTFTEDADVTLQDFDADLRDYALTIRHSEGSLAPGETALFSYVVALGDSDEEAQDAYDDVLADCTRCDDDGDGFKDAECGPLAPDCDDDEALAYPGAAEVWYDGIDGDCLGQDDYDADDDGYAPDEYADETNLQNGDCDDAEPAANPDAAEVWYDGIDQDCDGNDADQDEDGYESDAVGGDDCDDLSAAAHPGAADAWYDGVDRDCSGGSDYDADADSHDSAAHGGDDCDDANAAINPSSAEIWYDGSDSDCDGEDDYDADRDQYAPDEYADETSLQNGDCDDEDPAANPEAIEVWYDGLDADCDGLSDYDADADDHDSSAHGGDDCDDADAAINPDSAEIWYDGLDADCDGNDLDADLDGYDSADFGGDDCDDADPGLSPGEPEVYYDGADSDCDETNEYDADEDDHDSADFGGDDCDDADAGVNPSQAEVWYDGVDRDCAGDGDYDADKDGHLHEDYTGDDCDDTDPDVYPGAVEVWYDGADQDCDDASDYDKDGDGVDSQDYDGADCDDTDPEIGACDEIGLLYGGGGAKCASLPASSAGGWAGLLALAGLARRRRR